MSLSPAHAHYELGPPRSPQHQWVCYRSGGQKAAPVGRAFKFAAFGGRGQGAVHSARARGVATGGGSRAEFAEAGKDMERQGVSEVRVSRVRAPGGVKAAENRDSLHTLEPGLCSPRSEPPLAGRGEVS